MNWFLYFKMWFMLGEKPPKSVLLVGSRKPTSTEIEYGKILEHPIGVRCMKCDTPLYVHKKITHNSFCTWLYAMPCPKCAAQHRVQRMQSAAEACGNFKKARDGKCFNCGFGKAAHR